MDSTARKAKLGQKWVCYSCQAKFYDLNKVDPNCPKCGADQRMSPAFEKPKRSRAKKPAAPPAPKKAVKPPPPIDEADDLDTPIDADDTGFEDIEIEDGAVETPEIEEPEEEPPVEEDDD
jgi:uncharacterized protein (TIGR02300 family)